jgi:hypothetical protein
VSTVTREVYVSPTLEEIAHIYDWCATMDDEKLIAAIAATDDDDDDLFVLKPIRRCARSRSSPSPLTPSAARKRRRGRLAVMTMCRSPSARASSWQKFVSICPKPPIFCCGCMSPLLAQSRHPDRVGECPLSAVKRTSRIKSTMSAFDPKRTLHATV